MKILFSLSLVIATILTSPINGQTPGWVNYAGSPTDEIGKSIAKSGDGFTYVTGTFSGTLDIEPGAGVTNLISAGGTDIFLVKFNPFGAMVWARQIGGGGNETPNDLVLQGDSALYITGSYYSTIDFDAGLGTSNLVSAGSSDVFITKYSMNGSFIWARSMGGPSGDEGVSIATDTLGNVYSTGFYYNLGDFDPGAGTFTLTSSGTYDIYISKLDSSGNFVWAKSIGGTFPDFPSGIALDKKCNVYTTGTVFGVIDFDPGPGVSSVTGSGNYDAYISKLDSAGNFIFGKEFSGTNSDYGNDIFIDWKGNIFSTGYFYGTVDFNPGAGLMELTSNGGEDAYICKMDSSGNFGWAVSFGSNGEDRGEAIYADGTGNVYCAGIFQETVDFDPGTGTSTFSSPIGFQNTYFLSLNALNGSLLWAGSFEGTANNGVEGIASDNAGSVYLTGFFEATTDFYSGSGSLVWNSNGMKDIFYGWYCSPPTNISILSGANNLCEGDIATYVATPMSGGIYYYWTTPSDWGINSVGYELEIVAGSMSGEVAVYLGNGCDYTDTVTMTVTVNPVVTAGVNISVSPGDSIVSGTSVTFTATPVNPGASPSYQWKLNGSNVGTNNPVYATATINNLDAVSCELVSNAACVNGNPATSNIITMEVSPSGINESENNKGFTIYPNPCKDKLFIRSAFSEDKICIRIVNTLGEMVLENNDYRAKEAVNLSTVPPGIYIILISSGQFESKKMFSVLE